MTTTKTTLGLAAALSILTASHLAYAGCTKDTDCKGQRVCEGGRCVSPSATPQPPSYPPRSYAPQQQRSRAVAPSYPTRRAPAGGYQAPPHVAPPAVAPRSAVGPQAAAPRVMAPRAMPPRAVAPRAVAPQPMAAGVSQRYAAPRWAKGYAAIYSTIAFGGRGGVTGLDDIDFEESTKGGLSLAGYYAFSNVFHLGGHFSFSKSGLESEPVYYDGERIRLLVGEGSEISAGLAMKLGGTVGSRVWMGAALNTGFAAIGDDTGTQTFLGFEVDVLLTGSGGFKCALSGRLGAQVSLMSLGDTDEYYWKVRTMLQFGVTFGG